MEGLLEVGGVSWLEVEDRAEVQGLTGGNQLEEGAGAMGWLGDQATGLVSRAQGVHRPGVSRGSGSLWWMRRIGT